MCLSCMLEQCLRWPILPNFGTKFPEIQYNLVPNSFLVPNCTEFGTEQNWYQISIKKFGSSITIDTALMVQELKM